jgi:RNA polymerase sigma factor (sigma-70 family)
MTATLAVLPDSVPEPVTADPAGQQPSDWDLVLAAQAGDSAAFARFYAVYQPQIRVWLRRYQVSNFDQADDATADTFTEMLHWLRTAPRDRFTHYVSAGVSVTTVLRHIARNVVRRHAQRAYVQRECPLPEHAADLWGSDEYDHEYGNPEHEVLSRFDHEAIHLAVHTALDQLPPQQRRSVELMWLQQRPAREVADVMGLAEITVFNTTRVARRALASTLAPGTDWRQGYPVALGRARTQHTQRLRGITTPTQAPTWAADLRQVVTFLAAAAGRAGRQACEIRDAVFTEADTATVLAELVTAGAVVRERRCRTVVVYVLARLWTDQRDARLATRTLEFIAAAGPAGRTRHEIRRKLGSNGLDTHLPAVLDELVAAGHLARVRRRPNGPGRRMSEVYVARTPHTSAGVSTADPMSTREIAGCAA